MQTGVDGLIELLKKKNTMALAEAAKVLTTSEEIVKQWVDFLVEEKIVGIEYKFTKPYIYLNRPDERRKTKVIEREKLSIAKFKEDFYQRAKQSNIPVAQIDFLWRDHITNRLELEKSHFYQEARKRSLEHIDLLWQEYFRRVIEV